ncbi:class I SAM-dependent methyltransferase [Streptomyces profundus]|uniref:class I SAM-dependent methyltransferase n=1 Tax=Streptomyces profundus TaxID=2867410 RepID=UPI001D168881|nr:class I SAM-dependent methyltransferase [Streptomyces sp. MA3_2.13]UED85784.1 class I SAM-dependent methyltransferase [Streptomyces sp. MA3_2.13]
MSTHRPHEHGPLLPPDSGDPLANERYWDERYAASDHLWSGEPNAAMVEETAGLAPGTALDLGCGEGGDAIHLAGRGWRVTGVDVSGVALARAAEHAAAAGVADRVDWRRHDLTESFPAGLFDLVTTHFLHFTDATLGPKVLRGAASAVAPGGTLLIEAHAGFPEWEHGHPTDVPFPTPEETVAALALDPAEWEVLRAERHKRVQHHPTTGEPTTRTDQTVKARRRPTGGR